MICRELQDRVVAYLDGDLDDRRAAECRGHLRTCDACRALADEHARLRDALTQLPAPDPAPALWGQIRARLDADEVAASQPSRLTRGVTRTLGRLGDWARPALRPLALAGSAAALAVLVVKLRTPTPHGGAVAPAVALAPAAGAPTATEPAPPVVIMRDALDERADREAVEEARLRQVTTELLALARPEAATWGAGRAARFDREVERRERAILAAAPGAARARAWHDLTAFLERTALGEQVASAGGGR
ncbi:MAG: zf-HC2 domain-containing protein [Kofleriaceae bacterium]